MSRFAEYQKIINQLNIEKEHFSKKGKRYSTIRLGLFVLALVLAYQFISFSPVLAIFTVLILSAFFLMVIKWDSRNASAINKRKDLIRIYQNELRDIKADNLFGNGMEFKDPKHHYSFDLDIFGSFSLFNFLNRTVSREGRNILATWLKMPSEKAIIQKRQSAVMELSKKRIFKEEFLRTVFLENKKEPAASLMNWVNSFSVSLRHKLKLKWLMFTLSILSFSLIIGGFFLPKWWSLLPISILINYLVLSRHSNAVNLIHEYINNQSKLFLKYARLIHLISQEPFNEEITSKLREKLLKHHKAEDELKKLSKLSRKLDNRYNVVISFPLNLLFFWEIFVAMAVEKWFLRNREHIGGWLQIIGEMDALLSLGILSHNHPDWPFPEIHQEYFKLEAKGIGHPLIPKQQCVTNDYAITGDSCMDLVTGSNMAGKSTFLRALGVNTVLALAGAPVCAKSMAVSPAKILTYMRVQDSLEENASSFYAELERIRKILEAVENKEPCFLLLDEVLKGTNSNDRHIGSVALIKQLLKHKVAGLMATHDLGLTGIADEYPDQIRNFHFDVQVEKEELFFDYKLKTGICKSFNASLLMKKIGIAIDEL